MIRFRAHFDGEKLWPDEPVTLPQGVPLEVSVSDHSASVETQPGGQADAWHDLANLIQQAQVETRIPDLAAEHDHYLRGKPKRDG